MIKSLTIIFLFQLGGEIVSHLVRLPIPGNVIGMLLLTAALSLGWVKPESVRSGAETLVNNLAFLFVPPGVGLMLYFDLIGAQWPAIVIGVTVSTFVVMAIVGRTAQALER